MQQKVAGLITGEDGYPRTPEDEAHLNQLVFHTFATPAGQRCLEYLRSITVEVVMSPNDPDTVLRHMEGARGLVHIIQRRIRAMETR